MRFIKNWKAYFLISVILIYSLYGVNIYQKEKSQPSEGFSRHVELAKFDVDSFQQSRNISTITESVISEERSESLGTLYYENGLKYLIIDGSGGLISSMELDITFKNLLSIKADLFSTDKISFYAVDDFTLYRYEYIFADKSLSKEQIADGISSFDVNGDFLVASGKETTDIMFRENNSYKLLGVIDTLPRKSSSNKYDNYYVYTYVATDKAGVLKLWTYIYDNTDNTYSNIAVSKLPDNASYSSSAVSLEYDRDSDTNLSGSIGLIHEGIDYKTGFSTLSYFRSGPDFFNNIKEYMTTCDGSSVKAIDGDVSFETMLLDDIKYAQNTHLIYNNGSSISFVGRVPSDTGDSEIAYDIFRFDYKVVADEDGDPAVIDSVQLTKTAGNSANPFYFKMNDKSYLLWTDSVGLNKRILIAGEDASIISTGASMTKDEVVDTVMTSIFTIFPTLFSLLIPTLSIAGPILLALIIISFVNLTYVESKGAIVMPIAIVSHMLLKIYFTYSSILHNPKDMSVILPWYFQNPLLIWPLIMLVSAIAIHISYLRNKHIFKTKDVWSSYLGFMVTDLALYGVLVMPYVYNFIKL